VWKEFVADLVVQVVVFCSTRTEFSQLTCSTASLVISKRSADCTSTTCLISVGICLSFFLGFLIKSFRSGFTLPWARIPVQGVFLGGALVSIVLTLRMNACLCEQFRLNGDMYLAHCVETAMILAATGVGSAVVAAGLLHDAIDDSNLSLQLLRGALGEDVASLVIGVRNL
jgi:hypothetical protein